MLLNARIRKEETNDEEKIDVVSFKKGPPRGIINNRLSDKKSKYPIQCFACLNRWEEFESSTPTQKLEYCRNFFVERMKIEKGGTKRGNIIIDDALCKENNIKKKIEIQLRDAAFILREQIQYQENHQLPKN